jgi:hypothetical protein
METYIPRVFLVGMGLSILSVFGRPDYNLPLFAFCYILWDEVERGENIW